MTAASCPGPRVQLDRGRFRGFEKSAPATSGLPECCDNVGLQRSAKARPGRDRGAIGKRWRSRCAPVRWLPDRLPSTTSGCRPRRAPNRRPWKRSGPSSVVALPVPLAPKLRVSTAETEHMPIYLRRYSRVLSSWVHYLKPQVSGPFRSRRASSGRAALMAVGHRSRCRPPGSMTTPSSACRLMQDCFEPTEPVTTGSRSSEPWPTPGADRGGAPEMSHRCRSRSGTRVLRLHTRYFASRRWCPQGRLEWTSRNTAGESTAQRSPRPEAIEAPRPNVEVGALPSCRGAARRSSGGAARLRAPSPAHG
jgi:hypothetical protein